MSSHAPLQPHCDASWTNRKPGASLCVHVSVQPSAAAPIRGYDGDEEPGRQSGCCLEDGGNICAETEIRLGVRVWEADNPAVRRGLRASAVRPGESVGEPDSCTEPRPVTTIEGVVACAHAPPVIGAAGNAVGDGGVVRERSAIGGEEA